MSFPAGTSVNGADSEGAGEVRRHAGGKRRQAREMALQMLYQRELGRLEAHQLVRAFDLHAFRAETADAAALPESSTQALGYARTLLEGVQSHQESLDDLIDRQADNWRLERMPVVDRNILRLAVYELSHQRDVPGIVVIDEAVELAKKFGSEQSGAFINGILDALLVRLGHR